jgi:hypothetical protein
VLSIGLVILRALDYRSLGSLDSDQLLITGSAGGLFAILVIVFTFNLRLVEKLSAQASDTARSRVWLLAPILHSKALALGFGAATGYFGAAVCQPLDLDPSTAALAGFVGAFILVCLSSAAQLAICLLAHPSASTAFLYIDLCVPAHFEAVSDLLGRVKQAPQPNMRQANVSLGDRKSKASTTSVDSHERPPSFSSMPDLPAFQSEQSTV